MDIHVLLFPQYETLDAFGPIEILGQAGYTMHLVSLEGGLVKNAQGIETVTEKAQDHAGIWLIPGGKGTRPLSKDTAFLQSLVNLTKRADWILSVCTGSALLGAAGLLDGRHATSNKRAFQWVESLRPAVHWEPSARWVKDGRFYTASGVSAGIDMALGFTADREGIDKARAIAERVEYVWREDPSVDPFAVAMAARP